MLVSHAEANKSSSIPYFPEQGPMGVQYPKRESSCTRANTVNLSRSGLVPMRASQSDTFRYPRKIMTLLAISCSPPTPLFEFQPSGCLLCTPLISSQSPGCDKDLGARRHCAHVDHPKMVHTVPLLHPLF